jgi:hypothetical protein
VQLVRERRIPLSTLAESTQGSLGAALWRLLLIVSG